MRSPIWILLAALVLCGCDDDGGSTVIEDDTASDAQVTGDTTATDADATDPPDGEDGQDGEDGEDGEDGCSSSTFPEPCEPLENEWDNGGYACRDDATLSECVIRVSDDGCYAWSEWVDSPCATGESCVVNEGCVPPPPEPRGTCETHDDCPPDSTCVAVIDDPQDPTGPWRTCTSGPPEATACSGGAGMDACCDSAECTDAVGGGCFTGPLFYCGGVAPQPANVCLYDLCESDADCPEDGPGISICLPRGAFGEPRARCDASSSCRFDEDCASRAGGACLPFFGACNDRFAGFHCTYDDSTCRSDADCPDGETCTPGTDGATTCEEFIPPP